LLNALAHSSQTAQYSLLSRMERFADSKLVHVLENILEEIRRGKFAHEWSSEFANGAPRLAALRNKRAALALWQHEARTRQMRDSAAQKDT
jgi:ketol-acid reductoisomerase